MIDKFNVKLKKSKVKLNATIDKDTFEKVDKIVKEKNSNRSEVTNVLLGIGINVFGQMKKQMKNAN